MIELILVDGWCEGTYQADLERPPEQLLAVTGPRGSFVLDLPGDTPDADETVHVYQLESIGHVCQRSGKGRGCRLTAVYEKALSPAREAERILEGTQSSIMDWAHRVLEQGAE